MQLSKKEIAIFQQKILKYYKESGRIFPWRETSDPYKILVSEIMLQQTQTDRVIPKFSAFIKAFPHFKKLAVASVTDIFTLWHGLGYNRRALFLKRCAETVVNDYNGKLPTTLDELQKLPGIGPYTAAAVCAFAFNKKVVVIETNIRTVFIHEFFKDQETIGDTEILPLIEQTISNNSRIWYWALMDYGAMIKKKYGNPSRKSKQYSKQSKFEGSNRQVRGMILKLLLKSPQTEDNLLNQIPRNQILTRKIISDLIHEGFIKRQGHQLVIAS